MKKYHINMRVVSFNPYVNCYVIVHIDIVMIK